MNFAKYLKSLGQSTELSHGRRFCLELDNFFGSAVFIVFNPAVFIVSQLFPAVFYISHFGLVIYSCSVSHFFWRRICCAKNLHSAQSFFAAAAFGKMRDIFYTRKCA